MPATTPTAPQAIVDVMNAYAHALDVRDWDLFESLFTEDVRFTAQQYQDNAVPGDNFMDMTGRDALVQSLRTIWDGLSATHHLLSNYTVSPRDDGRSASASCYLRAHHVGNRERSHLFEESLGRFDFDMVREDGSWKIAAMSENIFVILGTQDAFPPQG